MNTTSTRRAIIETWAQAWSESDEARRIELLRQAATPDCAYTDPNVDLAGHTAISTYMAGFQESAPGARFVTTAFKSHHDHCLVQWNMVGADNTILSPGVSAGTFDSEGRLLQMVGFFGA